VIGASIPICTPLEHEAVVAAGDAGLADAAETIASTTARSTRPGREAPTARPGHRNVIARASLNASSGRSGAVSASSPATSTGGSAATTWIWPPSSGRA